MPSSNHDPDETRALTADIDDIDTESHSGELTLRESISSASTTSLILDQLGNTRHLTSKSKPYSDDPNANGKVRRDKFNLDEELDIEDSLYTLPRPFDKKARRLLWAVGILCATGWAIAAALFIIRGGYKHSNSIPHDPLATVSKGSGKTVTLDQVLQGRWRPRRHDIHWIAGPNGEDGLVLERGESRKPYLIVEDVRERNSQGEVSSRKVLMQDGTFRVGDHTVIPDEVWPSPDLKKVLVCSEKQSNWRHSFTCKYWIFDVETQTAEPLDPGDRVGIVQLASWSPESSMISFTRENNMYIRVLDQAKTVKQITKDGGSSLFYGVPDWVYEEEVFADRSATWWSEDGQYIAYLQTDESLVPEFPVQYFLSRPSGKKPKPGEENYPEVRKIKYPKAGAPNPVVKLQFYDIKKDYSFSLPIENDFTDKDRLITEVVWVGKEGKVLVKETNRESDKMKVIIMDAVLRQGKTIREQDVQALDGGWFEVSEDTTYIPADPGAGRLQNGYVDTIIHEGNDHLAYFTPLDNPDPILLTSGDWEVVNAPSAIDLKNNWVYFVATKESSITRHVYRVNLLDGSNMIPITDTNSEGYYDVSFSCGAAYALLTYEGPDIPWQKVISLSGNALNINYEDTIENNAELKQFAANHELPIKIHSTVNIDGFELNVLERRPPHFDDSGRKQYPVLFWMYQGPGSQLIDRKFTVDFQSYVAANLGYIVVTLDGRGTGYRGRKTRCIVRGNLGYWEAHDQIATAKMWAEKNYVDRDRMAIWGWSFGGFMTLKVLEQDKGETFKYGMAVAPVTDWRFYGMWTPFSHFRYNWFAGPLVTTSNQLLV
jgi:dipeptidyl aminopeptidase